MILTLSIIGIMVAFLAHSTQAQPCFWPQSPLFDPLIPNSISFIPPTGSTEFSGKTSTTGERVFFYLHGLGGTGTSWNIVASRTAYGGSSGYPARQVVFDMPYTYLQNGSLQDAALDIDAELNSRAWNAQQIHGISPGENIVIAHSLGGLEALLLDSLYEDSLNFTRPFGGIIMLGSAIGGSDAAFALSSWGQNGAVQFVEDACSILSNPWLWMPSFLPPLRWFGSLDPLVQQAIQTSCSSLSNVLIPFALGRFNQPLVAEVQSLSPWPLNLSQRSPKIPVVQLYGVEEEPVFWRTAYSMYQSDSIGLSLAQDPFGFDEDDFLVDWASDQMARYQAQTLLAQASAQAHAQAQCQAWLNPVASIYHAWQRQRAEEQSVAAAKAHQWYAQANNVFKEYIGAREIGMAHEGYWCRCRGDEDPPFTWTIVAQASDCYSNDPYAQCHVWPRWEVQITERPNDGIVLASSAGNLPGAVAHIELPQTNHQQMRNSQYTRDVFKRLFNGQIPGGPFFMTSLR